MGVSDAISSMFSSKQKTQAELDQEEEERKKKKLAQQNSISNQIDSRTRVNKINQYLKDAE
jgi:hypothetical protein